MALHPRSEWSIKPGTVLCITPPRSSFPHAESFENVLMLFDVLVTSRQIGPVIRTRLQGFLRVSLVRGRDGSLDIHPGAEMCDHRVIVVNLGLRPVSDNLACSLKIGVVRRRFHVQ